MYDAVHSFAHAVIGPSGRGYLVRLYGEHRPDGTWEGWLGFFPLDQGVALATTRDTVQPSREALDDWARQLSGVYMAEALRRAEAMSPRQADIATRLADIK